MFPAKHRNYEKVEGSRGGGGKVGKRGHREWNEISRFGFGGGVSGKREILWDLRGEGGINARCKSPGKEGGGERVRFLCIFFVFFVFSPPVSCVFFVSFLGRREVLFDKSPLG